jgi:hypothetical protein
MFETIGGNGETISDELKDSICCRCGETILGRKCIGGGGGEIRWWEAPVLSPLVVVDTRFPAQNSSISSISHLQNLQNLQYRLMLPVPVSTMR